MNTAIGYNRFKDKVGQCSKEKEKKKRKRQLRESNLLGKYSKKSLIVWNFKNTKAFKSCVCRATYYICRNYEWTKFLTDYIQQIFLEKLNNVKIVGVFNICFNYKIYSNY